MADIVDVATRSRMMSGIRGTNTKPELELRKALHRDGFRFRLHVRTLPGRPDILLPKYRTAVFVNGCFWHGHDGCRYFKIPASRTGFWMEKIQANRERDIRQHAVIRESGWRVGVVWECAIRRGLPESVSELETWIRARDSEIADIAWTEFEEEPSEVRLTTESVG